MVYQHISEVFAFFLEGVDICLQVFNLVVSVVNLVGNLVKFFLQRIYLIIEGIDLVFFLGNLFQSLSLPEVFVF